MIQITKVWTNWIQGAVRGKINNCWKRFQREWTDKLMNDSSFTDPIPSNQADFVKLVLARSDYKNRKKRDDSNTILQKSTTVFSVKVNR